MRCKYCDNEYDPDFNVEHEDVCMETCDCGNKSLLGFNGKCAKCYREQWKQPKEIIKPKHWRT